MSFDTFIFLLFYFSIVLLLFSIVLFFCCSIVLGNFYSSQEQFNESIPHYENYLSVAEKLQDKTEMCKASHNLAYAYYRIDNYNESIEYYEQNISLANDLNDRDSLSLAYCNLGLAYLAMNDFEKAVRCQKLFLASAREKKNILSICKAYGNLGTIYMKMGDTEEGLRFFSEQVRTADESNLTYLQADCYHELAKVLVDEEKYEEATMRYRKELSLRRQLNNEPTLFYRALLSFAAMQEKLGKLGEAYKCYCELFQLTKKHSNLEQCRNVCYLMGKINMKMGKYQKAISAFRLQLECINDLIYDSLEAGRIHVDIAECFIQLKDFDNAIQHLLEYQCIASQMQSYADENEAYKKLSKVHKTCGSFQDALLYSEKRLICTQEMKDVDICEAYKDVASSHAMLENNDSAISYYEQLLKVARDAKLTEFEYEAYKGLGTTYDVIKDHDKSLYSHIAAMESAKKINNNVFEAESCINIGDQYNILHKNQEALQHYEKALLFSEDFENNLIKVQVCGRLGRLHHLLANTSVAITYLRLAATDSEELEDRGEKIKAFYRLGLILYFEKKIEASSKYFQKVIDIIEQTNEPSTNSFKADVIQFIIASYQMLQKLLIVQQKTLEALFVAEKANSISLEMLLRDTGVKAHVKIPLFEKFSQRVHDVGTNVCFYSIVVGQLYCWLLQSNAGVVQFKKHRIIEKYTDANLPSLDLDDLVLYSLKDAQTKLDQFVQDLRQSLDVEKHERQLSKLTPSFAANIEIVDRRQSRKSRIGRPVVMSSHFDNSATAPTYQFSYKRPEKATFEHRANKNLNWHLDAPLEDLYKLLISQADNYFEQIQEEDKPRQNVIDLTFVVPRELSLIPFTLLKGEKYEKFLHERYNISYSPTLFWLLDNRIDNIENVECNEAEDIFVFGGCEDCSTDEATQISRIFGSSAVVGNNTLKDDIITRLSSSIVCHLSTDVAWQTPSFVFPFKDIAKEFTQTDCSDPDIEDLDPDNHRVGSPGLSDIFLNVKDISELQFKANLLTFGIAPSGGYSDPICPDGLHLLVTSLLMTGCKTLLTSLWTIPQNARKYFLSNFYQLYNKGIPAYEACNETVRMMQKSDEFNHPSNWSGFIVYGQNSRLYRKSQSFIHTLHEFLDNPNRDSIKVVLHLVSENIFT